MNLLATLSHAHAGALWGRHGNICSLTAHFHDVILGVVHVNSPDPGERKVLYWCMESSPAAHGKLRRSAQKKRQLKGKIRSSHLE